MDLVVEGLENGHHELVGLQDRGGEGGGQGVRAGGVGVGVGGNGPEADDQSDQGVADSDWPVICFLSGNTLCR